MSLAAVTALTGNTVGYTRQQLERLVSVHLLTETEGSRYQFHDLLRDYAAERVQDDEPIGSRDAATQRLYQWYLHTAHAAMFAFYPQHPVIPIDRPPADYRPLVFHGREHARHWFTSEHANLLAIIRRAPAVGQHTVAWQLPIAFDSYLVEDHHVADQITVHTLSLAAAESLDHQLGQRWAYGLLGEAHYQAHQHDEAIHYQRRALEIAQNTQDAFGKAASLGDLARSCIELERYVEAVRYSEEALQINRAIGHKRNEGIDLLHLGNALSHMGDYDQAMQYLSQGMTILRDIGSTGSEAIALRSISRILHERGDHENACNCLEQAIALYRELRVDHWYGETLTEYGDLLISMGQSSRARDAWRDALRILTELDPHDARKVQQRLDALDTNDHSISV
jgi:tetratricopeptide (TPR) repeat protein